MIKCRAGWPRIAVIAVLAVVSYVSDPTIAAAQAVNADQALSLFNGLSSDQQQQILQQLGGSAAAGAGNTSNNPVNRQGNANTNGETNATQRRGNNANGTNANGISNDALAAALGLQPGDSILIEVEPVGQRVITQSLPPGLIPGSTTQQAQQGQLVTPPSVINNGNNAANSSGSNPNAPTTTITTSTTTIPAPTLTVEEKLKRDELIKLIRDRNPFLIDRNGAVQLPGFAPIAIAGLSDELATKRLAAEPALRNIEIRITRLPLAKAGGAALKAYGYDLFEGGPSTFAPLSDVPVPSDYVMGPGDELAVQLYGSQNRTLRLTVSRDGSVSFPELGPINVGGRSFSTVRNDVEGRVSRQMIGVRANVSMGATRSIRVFVLGEANFPGTYTVSGLSTITSALYAAGGVKAIGSLRNIQLKRQGRVVRSLDLYDLLMRGDTSNDASLLPGDAIFIPSVGDTVSVDGEVRRAAIYELRGSASASDLVAMAGGFTTEADTARASLTRVNERQQRVVIEIAPAGTAAAATQLRNGDALRVARLRPTLDAGITVQGAVFRPGNFAWHSGMRLSDVIGSVNELRADADPHYLLIRREIPPDRRIAVASADLTGALANPGSDSNILLSANDQITVFDRVAERDRVIKPLMEEIRQQSNAATPAQVVNVSGRVKVPGDYPLEIGMRVSDLIRAGGSLVDAAYSGRADLSRYVVENDQTRRSQVIDIDLAAVLRGDATANIALQPFDALFIKEISGWSEQEQVTLKGEVKFPGTYPIKRGETLRSVIDRAGGLTELAFAQGSVFTREELKVREQEQLDRLAERMRSDLLSMSLMAARANQSGATQTTTIGQSLLEQLRSAKAVGRLVIDLPGVVSAPVGSSVDVILRNGDTLIVPKRRQEVSVMGEVQNVTSHLYAGGRSRDDYIALSGGTTRQADKSKIYVVRADGSVVANNSGWLFRGGEQDIRAGDTIVVPLDTERTPALPLWQSVTQILYNLTVAFAAAKTF